MTEPARALDAVFGPESHGATPEARATTSSRTFVRSQHQLSAWREGAPGREINASEAVRDFGWDVLRQLVERTAAIIVRSGSDPLKALAQQIEVLGLEPNLVFRRAGWGRDSIKAFEEGRQVPFRRLERLAQLLSIEPSRLGRESGADADTELGFRLRDFGDSTRSNAKTKVSASSVLALAEAAWVVRKQRELSRLLGESFPLSEVTPDNDYGGYGRPAWRCGFRLAEQTRQRLGIAAHEPILSMTTLLEEILGIPVVHVELPQAFAGATISNGDARGIVVNTKGANDSVWVRRMTMAHELGHYLWDPPQRLRRLVVDKYRDIEPDFVVTKDPVEQRANAFAVEFLAPRDAIAQLFPSEADPEEGFRKVVTRFGIGRAAMAYHLTNRQVAVPDSVRHLHLEPEDDLKGREELSVGLFKLKSVPISRQGRFAVLVGRAERQGLISKDSAGALLACGPHEVDDALAYIRTLDSAPLPSATAP